MRKHGGIWLLLLIAVPLWPAEDRSVPPPVTSPDTATLSVALGWLESDRWFRDTTYRGRELTKASQNAPYLAVRGSYTPPTHNPWRVRVGVDTTVLYRRGEPGEAGWLGRVKSDNQVWLDTDVTLWHEDYPRWRLRFWHRSDQELSTARYRPGFGTLERDNCLELEFVLLGAE